MIQSLASPFSCVEITTRSHGARKDGKYQRYGKEEEWGVSGSKWTGEVGLMVACESWNCRKIGADGKRQTARKEIGAGALLSSHKTCGQTVLC